MIQPTPIGWLAEWLHIILWLLSKLKINYCKECRTNGSQRDIRFMRVSHRCRAVGSEGCQRMALKNPITRAAAEMHRATRKALGLPLLTRSRMNAPMPSRAVTIPSAIWIGNSPP